MFNLKQLTVEQAKWLYKVQPLFRYRTPMLEMFSFTSIPKIEFIDPTFVPKELSKIPKVISSELVRFYGTTDEEQIAVCEYNEKHIFGIAKGDNDHYEITYLWEKDNTRPVLWIYDDLPLLPDVGNYTKPGNEYEYTFVGRVLFNYYHFVHPFGNKVPFKNKTLSPSDTEKVVSELIRTNQIDFDKKDAYGRTEYDNFMGNRTFSDGFGDLFIPTTSRKALTTSPEVYKRRAELYKEHAGKLNDPVIATNIENELISMDRKYLEEDDSYAFYGSENKKFDTVRKKLLLTGGLTEGAGSEYLFNPNSLSEGYNAETFHIGANESRIGIAARSIETAKGGEQSAFIMRVFQYTKIIEPDCHTTRTLDFILPEKNHSIYLGRTIIENGKYVRLDDKNIKQYIGKLVKMRSIDYCQTKSDTGICGVCAGHLYEELGTESVGIYGLEIGSTFMNESMKALHGKKTSTMTVKAIEDYLVDTLPVLIK